MSLVGEIFWEDAQVSETAGPVPLSGPPPDETAAGLWRRLRIAALLAAAALPLPYLLAPGPQPAASWEDIDLGGLPEIRSENAILSATLVAAWQTVLIGKAGFDGAGYNGSYPGPVLRARPGDLIRIKFVNHLTEPSNLHFHGFRVTPQGHGDNVHIVVPPGESFEYAFRIPKEQPPGLFWYHDHLHGITENHVARGLGGAILIDGFAKEFHGLEGMAQKLLVIKDISLPGCQGPVLKATLHCRVVSVNGNADWHVTMRPGETQLWRICNQGANLWTHLALPGAALRVIGRDGTPAVRVTEISTMDVMPASRMDVLVTAGAAGQEPLLAKSLVTGSGKSMVLNRVIGTVSVAGVPVVPSAAPIRFPHQNDLRDGAVGAHRTVDFTEDSEAGRYFINGKMFDHKRLDLRVPFGAVEEWTVRNQTQDYHEFHIHQLGFQVIEINGRKQVFDGYLDDVQVPEMGEVKLLVPFTDPVLIGEFVFHCHVLNHEDHGMMANIEVYRQGATAVPHICRYADAGSSLIP